MKVLRIYIVSIVLLIGCKSSNNETIFSQKDTEKINQAFKEQKFIDVLDEFIQKAKSDPGFTNIVEIKFKQIDEEKYFLLSVTDFMGEKYDGFINLDTLIIAIKFLDGNIPDFIQKSHLDKSSEKYYKEKDRETRWDYRILYRIDHGKEMIRLKYEQISQIDSVGLDSSLYK